MELKNPDTNRRIKPRSRTHYQLVSTGKLAPETLEIETIQVIENSRQRMPFVRLIHHSKSTHFINIVEIADALYCSVWMIIDYITREFDEFKVNYHKKNIILIFPGYEPLIQEVIDDFVKIKLKKKANFNY